MKTRKSIDKKKNKNLMDPLSKFSDDEIRYLYMFFVENQSVSDIAISSDPSIFEKKSIWKYTKNRIYALIWKMRYLLLEKYGHKLKQTNVDREAARLLRRRSRLRNSR
ncbi:MAG: hypothetical protein ACP5T2_04805 [Thermoprotei archaeon]